MTVKRVTEDFLVDWLKSFGDIVDKEVTDEQRKEMDAELIDAMYRGEYGKMSNDALADLVKDRMGPLLTYIGTAMPDELDGWFDKMLALMREAYLEGYSDAIVYGDVA